MYVFLLKHKPRDEPEMNYHPCKQYDNDFVFEAQAVGTT